MLFHSVANVISRKFPKMFGRTARKMGRSKRFLIRGYCDTGWHAMQSFTRVTNLTAHFEGFGILAHRNVMFFLKRSSEKGPR